MKADAMKRLLPVVVADIERANIFADRVDSMITLAAVVDIVIVVRTKAKNDNECKERLNHILAIKRLIVPAR